MNTYLFYIVKCVKLFGSVLKVIIGDEIKEDIYLGEIYISYTKVR